METIIYPIYLYWKKVTSSAYQVDISGMDEECCFYITEAEITFSHHLDRATGEPVIEIDSFKNELGFVFDDITLAPGTNNIFGCVKSLLENDDDFYTKAFDAVADEYVFDGKGANDPESRWRAVGENDD